MTSREKRALRWGAAAVGVVLTLRAIAGLSRAARASRGELQAHADLLGHAQAEVRETPHLQDRAASVARRLVGLAPTLLDGTTPPEALADLSAHLNLAAARHNVTLERTDPVGDTVVVGRLHRLTVRVAVSSDIRGAVGMLRSLSDGNPVVLVKALRIMATDPASGNGSPELLKAELTVSGWYLGPEPKAKTS